jgi:hypothetical protein
MTSPKQVSANQANAQHSTGPTSEAGKAKSSLNAVKSGLTGMTVLLPAEDAVLYEANIAALTAQYSPVGPAEQRLVQAIADAEWRLKRIPGLELGIYATGYSEFAPLFLSEPEHLRSTMTRSKTYETYEKQLRNLQLQEGRIRRHRKSDIDELLALQARREAEAKATHENQVAVATASFIEACEAGTEEKWSSAENGFEFSIAEIAVLLNQQRPDIFEVYLPLLCKKMAA